MTLLMREQEIASENFEKGIIQGIEQGIQQGMQQGIQQGMQQGRQQGIVQGIEQGIINQIETLKELNIEKDVIIEKTAVKFNKTKKEIENIYNKL